jgi:hypothetical protein
MTQGNELQTQPIHRASPGQRMLQDAGIALVRDPAVPVFGGGNRPGMGKTMAGKPLIIVPVAGALGGIFYYFMDHLLYRGGRREAPAYLLSRTGYIVAL